jgi:hypothetical protein
MVLNKEHTAGYLKQPPQEKEWIKYDRVTIPPSIRDILPKVLTGW